MAMELAKFFKQVQLLTTKNTPNQEASEVYVTYEHSENVFYYAGLSHIGTNQEVSLMQGTSLDPWIILTLIAIIFDAEITLTFHGKDSTKTKCIAKIWTKVCHHVHLISQP